MSVASPPDKKRRPSVYSFLFLRLFPLGLIFLLTCGEPSEVERTTLATTGSAQPLASLGGQIVEEKDLPAAARERLREIRLRLLRAYQQEATGFLEEEILQRESARTGLDQGHLIRELTGRNFRVTPEEVRAYQADWQKRNPTRPPPPESKIRAELLAGKARPHRGEALLKLLERYQPRNLVRMPFQPARPATGDRPALGPEDGLPVYVFFDYSSPLGLATRNTMDRLGEIFPEKIRWVFMHRPPANFPPAWSLHRIAECVRRQTNEGFWTSHRLFTLERDFLLGQVTRHERADIWYDNIQRQARELLRAEGLDQKRLTKCLSNLKDVDTLIDRDLDLVIANQVEEVPTWLIGDRRLDGPRPLWELKAVTDRALKKAGD